MTLTAFTPSQQSAAHRLLASCVASMLGRKLEEADWTSVYCKAKGIPQAGWSNLSIDVIHDGLGVEHKMLRTKSNRSVLDRCGESLMHPSATRSIRIPNDKAPTTAARKVLRQYAELIAERTEKVREQSPAKTPDMRTGYLLWQDSLREFLYFELPMEAPDPMAYTARWRESGGGVRKKSENLWVYETATGKKRYSITTDAGAKVQPYFDVPLPTDPNLYYFKVQGEVVGPGLVRVWINSTTALLLKSLVGSLDTESISGHIVALAADLATSAAEAGVTARGSAPAVEIVISADAYATLSATFPDVSDEAMMQLFAAQLAAQS